ncbi:MAG: hypothetical protein ABIZ05_08440 [Pseudonocardiaceae bacterium]
MSEHSATVPGAHVGDADAPRWGVSSQDWQSHAINVDAEHPDGMYVARCGQRLVRDITLYNDAPGWLCVSCLRWTRGAT